MKKNEYIKLLKIFNDSFGVENYEIDISYVNVIDNVISILNLKECSKINKIGHGTYSCVYQVNDKVLKIGMSKQNKRIIHHSKIIEVFLKENIEILSDNNRIKVGIEIQSLAVPNMNDNLDELYHVYKCLRDDGIIWCDVKTNNTGFVDNNLVVIDTDDCYLIDSIVKEPFVNDIAKRFEICYINNMEDFKNE